MSLPSESDRFECPLCNTESPLFCRATELGDYGICPECDLRFLDPKKRLGAEEEKSRYSLHDNDVTDPRYRSFLQPVVDAVKTRMPLGSKGLDFGAGPGPAAALMLEEAGYDVCLFDPVFHPEDGPLKEIYDFVLTTEVVEHFHQPAREFSRLKELLRPGGGLFVMTSLTDGVSDFRSWYYRRDPTHVVFYSSQTVEWIANRFDFLAEIVQPKVFLLTRVAK